MAQADGNVQDESNLRTVTVEWGFEVQNLIYGFDAQFNYLGFKVNGEYVTNVHRYQFADGVPGAGIDESSNQVWRTAREGQKYTQRDNAYYVTAQKDWGRFGFAGEVFKMGKFYRPHMSYYFPDLVYVTMWDARVYHDFMRISTIEDNDDGRSVSG